MIGKFIPALTNGLRIIASRMMHLSRREAEGFYGRPASVLSSRPGRVHDLRPVMVQVLEGRERYRQEPELMGATDPKKADKGTIRADFADSIDANAVHGSDAPETAAGEIAYYFRH